MPFGEFGLTSQPPLGLCSATYCIRFLWFPPHVCLPRVSVERTSGFSPSGAWFSSSVASGCVREEPRDAWYAWSCASFLTYFVVVLVSAMRHRPQPPPPLPRDGMRGTQPHPKPHAALPGRRAPARAPNSGHESVRIEAHRKTTQASVLPPTMESGPAPQSPAERK